MGVSVVVVFSDCSFFALLPLGLVAPEGVGKGGFSLSSAGAVLDEGHIARSCGDLATRCRHLWEHAQACSPRSSRDLGRLLI